MEPFLAEIGQLIEPMFRLLVALCFGMFIGVERERSGHFAGARTHGLVSLGAALFIIISELVALEYPRANIDPLRMASQIVVGIGFLGAGVIIFRNDSIHGLTTAAGLWVTAGIGVAVGFGLYGIAAFCTLLALLTFTIFGKFTR